MSDLTIYFERLEIHRVPGIRRGDGFTLSNLSPGINLIHGPNGSGKSTTARVIQALLWPGRTGLDRPWIAGQFHDGRDDWHTEIDAAHVECSCSGRTGTTPELGPPENRHRYHLALHELIKDDNAEFAKAIADASQGNYDLEAAAKAIGFRTKPPSRNRERKEIQNCRADVDKARHRQQEIQKSAAETDELCAKRKQAILAQQNIEYLKKAQEHHAAADECRRIKLELEAFPSGVVRLRGDERERLDELASQRDKLENDLLAERLRVEQAQRDLSEANIPDEGVDPQLVSRLQAWQRQLSTVESDIRQHRKRLSEATTEANQTMRRLGDRLTEQQLASIDTLEVGELSTFARQADRTRAQQQVLTEHRRWLEQEASDEVRQVDGGQLREGITALGHWLASPTPTAKVQSRVSWTLIIAVLVIAALGVGLALLYHWAWLLTVLVAAGLLALDWLLRRPSVDIATLDPRLVHRQSYEASRLQQPEAWEAPAVVELLRHLGHLIAIKATEEERKRRLDDLNAEAKAVSNRQHDLEQQRGDLEQRLGLNIQIADEWLPLLVDNISAWQRRNDEAIGTKEALANLEQGAAEFLNEINRSLHPFGSTDVDSAEAAAKLIEDLADRRERHKSATDMFCEGQRRINDTIEPGLQGVAAQRRAIYERLGIGDNEEATIDDWLAQRPAYLELASALSPAEARREDRRQALVNQEQLLDLGPAELQQQVEEQQTIADKRDELSAQIAGIEGDIKRAKQGHELSDALEARATAAARLAAARDENCRAVVGGALADWVRRVAIERSRPSVFRRANELLVRITHGTFTLELDDHTSPPAFLARRGSEPARPVEQLSIGERVQLLMAVRVAFMEQDEPARLPLLLDEALGTSDDERAGVIIDTVIDIAREGRLVFYFTAQHDEVGKWVARLQASALPHKVINLAQVRRLAAAQSTPLQIASIEVPMPPAPGGHSYEEYGHALGVPGLDPAAENLDGLHIWHLLDDAELLYQLLCRNIVTWGQLHTLLDHDGAGLIDAGDVRLNQAAIAAEAIEAGCEAWRVGRGKPVDRVALLDSGGVSEKFIDELSDLAKRVKGDARAVLEALEQGQVGRWRAKNTESLREHFEENGYLRETAPLQTDEIRVRVMAVVAEDLNAGRIEHALVDRIVGSLPLLG